MTSACLVFRATLRVRRKLLLAAKVAASPGLREVTLLISLALPTRPSNLYLCYFAKPTLQFVPLPTSLFALLCCAISAAASSFFSVGFHQQHSTYSALCSAHKAYITPPSAPHKSSYSYSYTLSFKTQSVFHLSIVNSNLALTSTLYAFIYPTNCTKFYHNASILLHGGQSSRH
jgi:hypothetical protein